MAQSGRHWHPNPQLMQQHSMPQGWQGTWPPPAGVALPPNFPGPPSMPPGANTHPHWKAGFWQYKPTSNMNGAGPGVYWATGMSASPVLQARATGGHSSPKMVLVLENMVPASSAPPLESKFTTATLTRALGSSVPFLLMHLPPPPSISSGNACHEETAEIPPPLSTATIYLQNRKFPTRAAAQARAGPKPAVICGFGPAWIFCRPEPSEARPKPRLLGQAGPEHHYMEGTGIAGLNLSQAQVIDGNHSRFQGDVSVLIVIRARAALIKVIADLLSGCRKCVDRMLSSDLADRIICRSQILYGYHCAEIRSQILSVASSLSPLENIVQFSSAAVIIFEHSFYIFYKRRYFRSTHPVRVTLQRYMTSPHSAAVREAVSTAIRAYEGNPSIWKALLPFERSQRKAGLIKTILEVILQHRLHLNPNEDRLKRGRYGATEVEA
ncbi:uncharacterized protein HD556DRAFT_1531647 [Suillus plorans]|uniref:Uncharacterized protein n=1 Tax=Suillus plorans TaxID=116603 RepID=A0A9P7AAH0_9AGAM|nr:uncharacterized protein HD556DRAFT_1531647 [Suillus plorans]KAG1785301.1 hypothetical protein HD556DRAFT_1531647 [Suillus plorans]